LKRLEHVAQEGFEGMDIHEAHSILTT
jgi:hypothetical protein